jgi:hypothetical protein
VVVQRRFPHTACGRLAARGSRKVTGVSGTETVRRDGFETRPDRATAFGCTALHMCTPSNKPQPQFREQQRHPDLSLKGANKCITQSVHCPEAVLTIVPYTNGHNLAAVGPELPQQTVTPPSSALHPMVVVPHGIYMCW